MRVKAGQGCPGKCRSNSQSGWRGDEEQLFVGRRSKFDAVCKSACPCCVQGLEVVPLTLEVRPG